MTPTAPLPALRELELPLAPGLLLLSVLGAALAWRAWRAGLATPARALLGACLPASLWLLLAALNPARPTQLAVTPLGAGLALSFLCGLVAARAAARRTGCGTECSLECYLWSCAAALLSAKVFHWLGKLGSGGSVPALTNGGLCASGALLGAVACVWCCFRQQPLRRRAWLDALAPALGLALAQSWSGAYLQDPTHSRLLLFAAAGLACSVLTLVLSALQRCHGQSFALAALGYGIVQLSMARADAARGVASWAASVASWLVIMLAIVAGWVWRKGFTLRGF
jgi:prolipoprotein diacylglyceryltransferase